MNDFIPFILPVLLLLIVAIGIVMLVLIYQKKQHQYLREKELLKQKFDKEILESMLEIKEQTFREVSEELHDNIAQVLTLVKLNLATIDINAVDEALEKINDSKVQLTNSIQDLRDIAKTLNTDFIQELGIANAIETELGKLEKTGTISVSFQVQGTLTPIEPKKELILFRIVQESIHNVIKHSQATTLKVVMVYKQTELILIITDNGVGFDQSQKNQGSGLKNMCNRCKLINAECIIESNLDQGTSLSIHLPL